MRNRPFPVLSAQKTCDPWLITGRVWKFGLASATPPMRNASLPRAFIAYLARARRRAVLFLQHLRAELAASTSTLSALLRHSLHPLTATVLGAVPHRAHHNAHHNLSALDANSNESSTAAEHEADEDLSTTLLVGVGALVLAVATYLWNIDGSAARSKAWFIEDRSEPSKQVLEPTDKLLTSESSPTAAPESSPIPLPESWVAVERPCIMLVDRAASEE